MLNAPVLHALNHLLNSATWARARLAPFSGKTARFDFPPVSLVFSVSPEGLFLPFPVDASTGQTDVSIRLPAHSLFAFPFDIDSIMSRVDVAGNAEFATALSFVLRGLRWDAEEDLSRLVGDIAARRLIDFSTSFVVFQREFSARASRNIAEYLSSEASLVARRGELDTFADAVTRLNGDISALELRFSRLA